MGNLPRSRPGRRSSKRGGDGDNAAKSAAGKPSAATASKTTAASGKSAAGRSTAKKTTPRRPAAKRTTASGAKPPATAHTRPRAQQTPKPKPSAEQPASRQATGGSTDPVTGAVMLAGKVVEGGLKVAGGIIKRLPRP